MTSLHGLCRQRMHQNTMLLSYLALLVSVIAVGFSPIFVSWTDAHGAVLAFYRESIAAVTMLCPFLYACRHHHVATQRSYKGMLVAIASGVLFAIEITIWNVSVKMTSVANSSLFNNLSVVWVSLFSCWLLAQRVPRAFWYGLLVAILGSLLIVKNDLQTNATSFTGDMLSLLASFVFAGFYLCMQYARKTLSAVVSFWLSAVGGAIFLGWMCWFWELPLTGYNAATYGCFVGLGLITQVGGYMSLGYALGKLPATLVTSFMLLQPVCAAWLAVMLLHQAITWCQIIGGLVCLGGVWWSHRAYTT
jgi:drug/metabolite transporter (DMT)-like permease